MVYSSQKELHYRYTTALTCKLAAHVGNVFPIDGTIPSNLELFQAF
jgi:hypothetical protein